MNDPIRTASRLWGFLARLYAAPLLVLVAAVVLSQVLGVPIGDFTRDPTTVAKLMPYVGSVSMVGVLLWTAAATACGIGWGVLRRRPDGHRMAGFFLHFGVVTAALGLDDLFLLHETAEHFGFNEKLLLLVYGGLLGAGLVRFREQILKTDFLLLIIGVGFLGLSVSVDVVQDQLDAILGTWRILVEDGFKLLGIAGWFGYFLRCALGAISPDASS